MQIVIDIPETLKDIANEGDIKTFSHSVWQAILIEAINNGVILPKGHGRLIDADEAAETVGWEMAGTGYQTTAVWPLKSDSYTPTIIEADEVE